MIKQEKKDLSVFERYLLIYAKIAMKNKIFAVDNSSLTKAINQDNYSFSLRNSITKATAHYMHLWEIMEEDSPSQSKVEFLGDKIIKCIAKIEQICNITIEAKLCTHKIITIYITFASRVMHDEDLTDTLKEL